MNLRNFNRILWLISLLLLEALFLAVSFASNTGSSIPPIPGGGRDRGSIPGPAVPVRSNGRHNANHIQVLPEVHEHGQVPSVNLTQEMPGFPAAAGNSIEQAPVPMELVNSAIPSSSVNSATTSPASSRPIEHAAASSSSSVSMQVAPQTSQKREFAELGLPAASSGALGKLQNNLAGFLKVPVRGDGHCLYRAITLYLTQGEDVAWLRSKIAKHLKRYQGEYENFLELEDGQTVEDYIHKVRATTQWGGNTEISILMKLLRRVIVVIGPEGQIRNLAEVRDNVHTYPYEPIFVYFNGVDHYDGLLVKGKRSGSELLARLLRNTPPSPEIRGAAAPQNSKMVVDTKELAGISPSKATEGLELVPNNFLVAHDQRPTDLEYALMSKFAYAKNLEDGQDTFEDDLSGWEIHEVRRGGAGERGYLGVAFRNDATKQIVIAHRGTVLINMGNWLEDIQSIIRAKTSAQEVVAFDFIKEIIKSREVQKYGYRVSFTGHSLGAFLAELSVFFCHNSFKYPNTNAVTFESPGSREALELLQSQHQPIKLHKLDIISYLGTPNIINSFNHHIGSFYQIEPDLGGMGWLPVFYTKQCHTIGNIVVYFKNHEVIPKYISDWPVPGWQRSKYFKHARWDSDKNGYFIEIKDGDGAKQFLVTYDAHYQVQEQLDPRFNLPLKHFGEGMQRFLVRFSTKFYDIVKDDNERQQIATKLNEARVPEEIVSYLLGFILLEDKSGRYYVRVRNTANIYQFRNRLSEYLQEPEKLREILTLVEAGKSRLKLEAILVETGGGTKGIDAAIYEIDDVGLIIIIRAEQLKFIKALEEMRAKIRVEAVKTVQHVMSSSMRVCSSMVETLVHGSKEDDIYDAWGIAKNTPIGR